MHHFKQIVGQSGLRSYLRVFTYADRTSWILNAIALVTAIGAGVPLPLMEVFFGQFVTSFLEFSQGRTGAEEYMADVSRLSLYFVYLFMGKAICVYIHSFCISMSAIRTIKALRIHFLQSLLRQDIAYFDSKDAGSPAIKSMSTFVTAFIVAFVVQWKLTLITLAIVPTIVIITAITIAVDAKNEQKLLSVYSKAGLLAEEVFSSIANVHAFWLHPTMAKRYDTLLAKAQTIGMEKRLNIGIMYSTEFFVIYCGYALAFWQGIRMYYAGEVDQPGKVVTVIFAIVAATTSLTQIAPQLVVVSKALSASSELFETIDQASAIDALSERGDTPRQCLGHIRFRNIHFAYPSRPDNAVLRGLDLEVPAGKTTAIVGESGSGKSTIIGLLERWYAPHSGGILMDGTHISRTNVRWLRTRIRLIQQEPVLFSGTIFENVSYGLVGTAHEHSTREDKLKLVQQACKDAFAHDFIEALPERYETAVGERARMLSGGQKQRIAIARSIISDPAVLLMDEATSALDPKAEQVVQAALDNVSINRTTIIIAHKLSTIQNADTIAVMREGIVIEQGTHQELLAREGAYARLVHAQDLTATQNTNSSDNGWDEKVNDHPDVEETEREESNVESQSEVCHNEERGKRYGLLRSLFILVQEQRGLWYWLICIAISCALAGGTYPAQAVIFARTFEVFEARRPNTLSDGNFWALMFFAVALAQWVIYFVMGWVSVVVSQTLTRTYRGRLFEAALYQKMDFFDKPVNESGGLTARLATTAQNLQELIGLNLFLIMINIANIVSSAIFGIAVGWKLGLVCVFGALPPLLFSGYLRIRLEGRLEDVVSDRFASSAAVAAEAISAIRTVSSLTLEWTVLQKYSDRLSDVASKSIRALSWTMFWYSLSQSIQFLAMALGFWYGGKLVSEGEYTTTQFFQVFIAVLFGGEAAAVVFQYTTSISWATPAANLMFQLQQTSTEVQHDNPPPPPVDEKIRGPAAVNYSTVGFAYPSRPSSQILKGVDVSIAAGQFIAFVGPSGCGKTTMLGLLNRYYDPSSGTIKLDGDPIMDKTVRQHRRQIGLVQQEPALYEGSIRDNVALGLADQREVTDAEIEKACTQANIWTFVKSLPEGLNTSVGLRGSQLSGGQKQRVAIARAIVRRPRIMLLDEATSALDTESEKVVQAALLDAAKEGARTTIAVAHRLSTIRDADKIFVFNSGKIAGAGSHQQLMAQRGQYYQMCRSQALDRAA